MLENMEKVLDFQYGENKQQSASLYKTERSLTTSILNGESLSYKDYLNMTVLVNVLSEFYDVNATVIAKSGLLCSTALGKSLTDSYSKAIDSNPISALDSCIGFSKPIDTRTAKKIVQNRVELVLAPNVEDEALEILKSVKNLKIVKLDTPLDEVKILETGELKVTPFGILEQETDRADFNKDLFKVRTKKKPEQEQLEDAIFAFKNVKYAKSDAAIIAKDFKIISICQSETNLASSCENAIDYACDSTKDAILACDRPIETPDVIHAAARGRIALIIEPGGSKNIAETIKQCDKYEIALVTTGIEHFKH